MIYSYRRKNIHENCVVCNVCIVSALRKKRKSHLQKRKFWERARERDKVSERRERTRKNCVCVRREREREQGERHEGRRIFFLEEIRDQGYNINTESNLENFFFVPYKRIEHTHTYIVGRKLSHRNFVLLHN